MTRAPINYAPKERKKLSSIFKENKQLEGLAHIHEFLGSLSQVIIIINEQLQVVFVNKVMLQKFGLQDPKEALGYRLGEILSCVNARKEASGCGTSRECTYCGALQTILRCRDTMRKEEGECRISGLDKENKPVNHDLQITVSPLEINEMNYYIVALADIAPIKRRKNLERTFFHDIMNIAGGLSSIMDLLPVMDEDQRDDFLQMAGVLSKQIVEEIKTQRILLQAENEELEVREEPLLSKDVLVKALQQMYHHEVAQSKFIRISLNSIQQTFNSDPVLLNRVLINMLKNALEATEDQGVVEMGCSPIGEHKLRFWVKNDVLMPESVRAQLFQRSFSTKGKGRGIGTYSIKLFGEKYLGGKVGYISSEKERTLFYIDL